MNRGSILELFNRLPPESYDEVRKGILEEAMRKGISREQLSELSIQMLDDDGLRQVVRDMQAQLDDRN